MNPQNIVRYWHAVELLQPQAVPKLKKRDFQSSFEYLPRSKTFLHNLGRLLPVATAAFCGFLPIFYGRDDRQRSNSGGLPFRMRL